MAEGIPGFYLYGTDDLDVGYVVNSLITQPGGDFSGFWGGSVAIGGGLYQAYLYDVSGTYIDGGDVSGLGASFNVLDYTQSYGTNAFDGVEIDNNGYVWMAPSYSDYIVKIDPNTGLVVKEIAHGYSNLAFSGIKKDPNGFLWIAPRNATRIVKIDPSDDTFELFTHSGGSSAFRGCEIDDNGFLWLCPYNSDYIIKFDTINGVEVGVFPHGYINAAFSGIKKDNNGFLWLSPFNATDIVKVDPSDGSLTRYPNLYDPAPFSSIEVDNNGFLWFIPYNGDYIIKVDPSDGSVVQEILHGYTSSGAFNFAAKDGSGFIWFAPYFADFFVRLDPADGTIVDYPSAFGGGAFTGIVYDGSDSLWLSPYSADFFVKIETLSTLVTPAPGTIAVIDDEVSPGTLCVTIDILDIPAFDGAYFASIYDPVGPVEYYSGRILSIDENEITLDQVIRALDGGGVSLLENYLFDSINSKHNSVVKIDDRHAIIAYSGADSDGFLQTVSISESGVITGIDILEFDTGQATNIDMIQIDTNRFLIAYSNLKGVAQTVTVDGSYNISLIDSVIYDTLGANYNSLTKLDSTHFALAYSTPFGNDGFLDIFEVDGSSTITLLNSLEHDNLNGYDTAIVTIDSTHIALVYNSSNIIFKTFSVDPLDNYNAIEIDSYTIANGQQSYLSMVSIGSNHFVLAYTELTTNDGIIKVFNVNESFVVTEVSSLRHDGNTTGFNSLTNIDNSSVALFYKSNGQPIVKIFNIDEVYTVTERSSSQIGIGTEYRDSCFLSNDIYISIQEETGSNDGYLSSYSISEGGVQVYPPSDWTSLYIVPDGYISNGAVGGVPIIVAEEIVEVIGSFGKYRAPIERFIDVDISTNYTRGIK